MAFTPQGDIVLGVYMVSEVKVLSIGPSVGGCTASKVKVPSPLRNVVTLA